MAVFPRPQHSFHSLIYHQPLLILCERMMSKAETLVAGLGGPLQALREILLWPILYYEEAKSLGLRWPRGLLLHGPPGTGKTSLVHAIAAECGAQLTLLSAGTVNKSYAGESERLLREVFLEAESHASSGQPTIIFIDEIDILCPHRDARRQHEARVVAQLLTLMDGIRFKEPSHSSMRVVVVAATNRLNAIDPALRRPGRFDREVAISAPTVEERHEILSLHARKLPMDGSVDLRVVAEHCNGYVGADLQALCREAAMRSIRKSIIDKDKGETQLIEMEDFLEARAKVGPSLVRGIAAEIPKVSWDDIGGLYDVKKKLQQSVEWPIKHSDAFQRLGLRPARGVLLHGPPGCSKTTLVKAVAHAAQTTLFSLSGAEMYSMYVGEGEALLREIFRRARLTIPSIIFFDEADTIAHRRMQGQNSSTTGLSSSTVGERLLSTLLTEMDGLELAQGVIVIAATNRPQVIDAAFMRPGRFDLVLYVPPPEMEARFEILKVHTRKMNLGDNVDLTRVAESTECFTGAELASLCREAAIAALRENLDATSVQKQHFDAARKAIHPALSPLEVASYANFRSRKSSKC